MDQASWSTREKLAIASFVDRLGDNEWVDAEKFLEPFCEVGRPSSWLAATACAHQMKELLAQYAGDERNISAAHDGILESLTRERITELEELVSEQHFHCARMRNELDLIESGSLDNELDELLEKAACHTNQGKVEHLREGGVDTNSKPIHRPDLGSSYALRRSGHTAKKSVFGNAAPAGRTNDTTLSCETAQNNAGQGMQAAASRYEQRHNLEAATESSIPSRSARIDLDISAHRGGENLNGGSKVSVKPQSPNLSKPSGHLVGNRNDSMHNTSFTSHDTTTVNKCASTTAGDTATTGVSMRERQIAANGDIVTKSLSPAGDSYPPSEGFVQNPVNQKIDRVLKKPDNDMETATYKAWKKSTMIVWNQIASHRYASIFMHPVTDEIAPNYSSTVYRAVDLSSIKRDIENGKMRTTSEFQRDLMLMFQNALMYNNADHHVYKMAREMQSEVMDHVAQFLITQIVVNQNRLNAAASGCTSDVEEPSVRERVVCASSNALLSLLVTKSRPKRAAAVDNRKKQS